MIVKNQSLDKYKNVFLNRGLEMSLLQKEDKDVERLVALILNVDSPFLFTGNSKMSLHTYAKKLIDNAYNIVLTEKNKDIAFISFYANDFINKIAYVSSIGILPSFRGGRTIFSLIKLSIEFAEEIKMEYLKAEVDKENSKWLNFLTRYYFEIERETENNTCIIVRNLKEKYSNSPV